MNTVFQLVNKTGKVALVQWEYIIDEGSLQKFEKFISTMSSQKWDKLTVKQKDVNDAVGLLRTLPRVPASDIQDAMDYATDPVYASNWNLGLYAWPMPTAFKNAQPIPPSLSKAITPELIDDLWTSCKDFDKAYKIFFKAIDEIEEKKWYRGNFLETSMYIEDDVFEKTQKIHTQISKKIVLLKTLNLSSDFWNAKNYVVYKVGSEYQEEGYLDAQLNCVPLPSARMFATLKDAQKAGEKATNYDGMFYVFESSVSVGQSVFTSDRDPGNSVVSNAIVQRSASELSAEVDGHLGTSKSARPSKARRI